MEKEKTTLSEDTAAAPMPISDTVVRALADSLAKIEEYVPTNYVDDEEPYLEAANLNKSEQAIMRVTRLMNSAVDVIKGLEGQALKKSDLVNNALTTTAGVAALDAAMGKTLGDQVTALNSDLGKRITYNCTGLITEITDFNEARTFGSYRSTLVAQIQSIANRPSDLTINGHVRLDVMALSEGASYILQRLYFMSTGGDFRIYHRVYLTSWGDWERASMTKIA